MSAPAAVSDVDLFGPEATRDPWPCIRELQAHGPVVWNTRIRHWMITTDQLCRKVLVDFDRFSIRDITAPFFGGDAFIAIDEKPAHDALRSVWQVAFQRQTLESVTPVIAGVAEQMLDTLQSRLLEGEVVDAVGAFCRDLPAWIIAHMLGSPEDVRPKIVEWSDLMGRAGGTPNVDRQSDPNWLASEAAKAELATHLFDQIAYRRAHPGEDLISQIVHSEVGRRLSDEAIMQNARQLLFAGNETTAKWLGHIVVTLARYPDVRRRLVGDPGLIPAAAEEIMRWEPVVQRIPRVVVQNLDLAGQPLRTGDQLLLMIGAANRDPDRYEDPERLDIDRAPKAHLGFGFGMHSCLGMTLARLEAKVATERLLARLPDYALAGPAEYGAFGLRGPARIPVAAR